MPASALVGAMTAPRSFVAIALSVLLLAAFAAGGAAGKRPGATEDEDKFVLSNDHVRVWFQGKKPMLKVLPANGSEEGAYEYHFTDVVEYRDVDGDGGPGAQEVVSSLNLNKASAWNVTRAEENGSVVLNLTLTAPVKLARGVELPQNVSLPSRDATVSLVFHIFEEETRIEAGNETVVVARAAVKYDFVVAQWPFVDAGQNRLALEALVGGVLDLGNETDEAEVVANETTVGALTWLSNATGTTADGATVDVPVRANVALEEGNMSRLVFTYDAPDLVTLLHDPTIGLSGAGAPAESGDGEGRSSVPGPGLVLVGLAAGAATAFRRRS